jgi:hypothetical protein
MRQLDAIFDGDTSRWILDNPQLDNMLESFQEAGFTIQEKELPSPRKIKVKALIKRLSETVEIEIAYRSDIINFLKEIPEKKFDIINGRWTFPISAYASILEKLVELNIDIKPIENEFPTKIKSASYVPL